MVWTQLAELKRQTQKLWDNGTLLRAQLEQDSLFPKRLLLKGPSSKELLDRFDEVRRWILTLQKQDDFRIEMKVTRHRIIGANEIPESAWIDSLEQAQKIIGKKKEAMRFQSIVTLCSQRNAALTDWLRDHPLNALQLDADWPRLLDVIDWFKSHSRANIYLRQIDIPGVHSKFIEQHRGTLISLLDIALPADTILKNFSGVRAFSKRYGMKDKPLRVRFRILDPEVCLLPGDSQDITITHNSFQSLHTDERIQGKIKRVFITENEINFLAFPALASSMVIFGAGYGFDNLADIPWLLHTQIHYWGDIDTHGFAILNQLRANLPHSQSLLMDRETLLHHQGLWVTESSQEHRQLSRLTMAEQQIYQDLTNNRYQQSLRLEQERIEFNWLLDALTTLP